MSALMQPVLYTNADFEAINMFPYPVNVFTSQLYAIIDGSYAHLRAIKHTLDNMGWETIWVDALKLR